MDLVEKIRQVFGVGSAPKAPLVESAYLNPMAQGDEGATEYFLGKRWIDTDVEMLLYHQEAMYMFLPEVHRYYLPAFMTVSITDNDEAGVIPENLIFHLSDYKNEFWWDRLKILNPEEYDVVAEFATDIALNDKYIFDDLLENTLDGWIKAKEKHAGSF